jgi:hypothetical protein
VPMSGAERQQRYRERHHGEPARTTLDLRSEARDRLDRLAVHYGVWLCWSRSSRRAPSGRGEADGEGA